MIPHEQLKHYIPTLHQNEKASYLIDASGKFVYCNPSTEILTGYSENELCQMSFADLITESEIAQTHAAFNESLEGIPQNIDTSILNKSGKRIELSVAVVPYFIEEKVEYVIGIAKDITQQKRALERLVESEARNRGIMRSSMDCIIITDQTLTIIEFNPAAEETFGFSRDEVIGKQLISLIFPKEDRAKYFEAKQTLLARNSFPFVGKRFELTGIRKSNEAFPMELGITTIYFDNKLFFTLYIRDITERKQLENSLIIAKEQAERSNLAKSAFLSSMSHELRTPLNAILGFAQLLKVTPLTTEQSEDIDEIIKAGNHLVHLINDVLDLSGIEAGKLSLSFAQVNLGEAIEEAVSLMGPLAKVKSVKMNWLNEKAPLFVSADATRLRQILVNLLSNALKYNKEEGEITISLKAAENPGFIRVSITDTGIGISQEQLTEIFNPFHRLNPSTTVEGAGVGLSIVKQLIEAMDGRIGVSSELNSGSEFWIELTEAIPVETSSKE